MVRKARVNSRCRCRPLRGARCRIEKSLGVLLFALMMLLVSAIIAIVGAARREGMLEPGQVPGPEHMRRGRWVMFGAAVVVLGLLFFGNWWWNSEAFAKARQMIYKAPPLNVSLDPSGKLILQMGDSDWHRTRPETVMTNLIPDHGHLMHFFLIREPGMDRFYHLHPQLQAGVRPVGTNSFALELPAIPAGRYQVFADVVRESGFPDTMMAEIDLPDIPGVPLVGDNSDASAPPLGGQPARPDRVPQARRAPMGPRWCCRTGIEWFGSAVLRRWWQITSFGCASGWKRRAASR